MLKAAAVILVLLIVAIGVAILRMRRPAAPVPDVLSLVLLRSAHSKLTETQIVEVVRRALHVEASIHKVPQSVGAAESFAIVADKLPSLFIISCPRPYMLPTPAGSPPQPVPADPLVRDAIANHSSWLAVDCLSPDHAPYSDQEKAAICNDLLGRLAAELAGDATLAIRLVPTERICLATPENLKRFAAGQSMEVFSDWESAERIVPITGPDHEIDAAADEARRRFPELVAAFAERGRSCRARVKYRFDAGDAGMESMWVQIVEIRDGQCAGPLLNQAFLPGQPAKGDRISISPERVVDWIYTDRHGALQGGFVERVLLRRKAQLPASAK